MTEFTFALDLPPGLDSNSTSFDAAGRWADGNEVRFVDGRPHATGPISGALNGIFNGARKLHAYSIGSTVRVAIASDGFLYSVIVDGPMWNITPALWNGIGGRGH